MISFLLNFYICVAVLKVKMCARVLAFFLCFFSLLFLLIGAASTPLTAEDPSCQEAGQDLATVLEINQTGTLILSDRREIRLDGILLPYPPTGLQNYESWPAWQSTIKNLQNRLVGREVLIKAGGRKYDRYSRLLAQIYLKTNKETGTETLWLQKQMVLDGEARVFPYEAQSLCATELLKLEMAARTAQKGVWSYEVYHIRKSDDLAKLLQLAGSFQIVEGQVQDVVTVRGTVYINFGQNWKEDFTVSVNRNALSNFQEGEKKLQSYKGRSLRVRGWIEQRNGPMISVTYPGQIEEM